jgi:hypothetical protein
VRAYTLAVDVLSCSGQSQWYYRHYQQICEIPARPPGDMPRHIIHAKEYIQSVAACLLQGVQGLTFTASKAGLVSCRSGITYAAIEPRDLAPRLADHVRHRVRCQLRRACACSFLSLSRSCCQGTGHIHVLCLSPNANGQVVPCILQYLSGIGTKQDWWVISVSKNAVGYSRSGGNFAQRVMKPSVFSFSYGGL